jgi:hypothetical protein
MSAEKRDSRRRAVMTPGMVMGGAKRALQICVVRNLSASGAKLGFNATDDVPDRFTLILSRDGSVNRDCIVVWRSDREVGVQFVRPAK